MSRYASMQLGLALDTLGQAGLLECSLSMSLQGLLVTAHATYPMAKEVFMVIAFKTFKYVWFCVWAY